MMKIDTIYFNRDIPNPAKGNSLRTNHCAGYTASKELEITLHEKSVFELYAPQKERAVYVPLSGVLWFSCEGRVYGPEENQEASKSDTKRREIQSAGDGQGTSTEDSEGSCEKAGTKDEPGPKRNTVRGTKGVRPRPIKK